ncbi:MAG TPA: c-type cytochrome [Longimicrobiaceae bacterium]|nr:c-type cytochrome [Longimicrobiaceae bacterium]
MTRRGRWVLFTVASLAIVACAARAGQAGTTARPATPADRALQQQVARGRELVLGHACGDCHGGFGNPAAAGFLTGMTSPIQEFQIGPFKTRPRNLTPDNTTGLGRFSERQIFNAIRYGLRPGETPDVEITSSTPGQGNFPANPKYLAPPMPWPSFRHMSDQEIRDMAAYLKHGLKPVSNRVADSEGPPDFWASEYTPEKIGTFPAAAFPTANEELRP